jgi:hypothetical protein
MERLVGLFRVSRGGGQEDSFKVHYNVLFVVGNVVVQSLSVYFEVYIKVARVMLFVVVKFYVCWKLGVKA